MLNFFLTVLQKISREFREMRFTGISRDFPGTKPTLFYNTYYDTDSLSMTICHMLCMKTKML